MAGAPDTLRFGRLMKGRIGRIDNIEVRPTSPTDLNRWTWIALPCVVDLALWPAGGGRTLRHGQGTRSTSWHHPHCKPPSGHGICPTSGGRGNRPSGAESIVRRPTEQYGETGRSRGCPAWACDHWPGGRHSGPPVRRSHHLRPTPDGRTCRHLGYRRGRDPLRHRN